MRVSAGIVLVAVGVASGCQGNFLIGPPPLAGSGVSKEETRAVDAFHAIEAGNALQVNVTITPGAKSSLKITGDDNLVPFVESVMRDGSLILRIKANSSVSPKVPLLAEVVASEIDEVKASGAASITVKGGAKVNHLTASASGQSSMRSRSA